MPTFKTVKLHHLSKLMKANYEATGGKFRHIWLFYSQIVRPHNEIVIGPLVGIKGFQSTVPD